ncbi:hypothetical protein EIN_182990 [Entamoeba invadens IP1]|uniref:hypothetical protein n=1 Tax=Entamoeba invadens IP1 TaxID=370355 RepID=UPI0002C3D638|nr:hypothetical protein EIN_182990 [Entamoeba invadens IP1]ELP94042.1 hypothetical protein EIN_182990 [Entamoeba invadens IP1]|eukprot:XP_004260813.1 hypothetical protein EIN_182990 [Entamoeba invadens IP1]
MDDHTDCICNYIEKVDMNQNTESDDTAIRLVISNMLQPKPIADQMDELLFSSKEEKEYFQSLPSNNCHCFMTDEYYICNCTEKPIFVCFDCNKRMLQNNHKNHSKGSHPINTLCQCGSCSSDITTHLQSPQQLSPQESKPDLIKCPQVPHNMNHPKVDLTTSASIMVQQKQVADISPPQMPTEKLKPKSKTKDKVSLQPKQPLSQLISTQKTKSLKKFAEKKDAIGKTLSEQKETARILLQKGNVKDKIELLKEIDTSRKQQKQEDKIKKKSESFKIAQEKLDEDRRRENNEKTIQQSIDVGLALQSEVPQALCYIHGYEQENSQLLSDAKKSVLGEQVVTLLTLLQHGDIPEYIQLCEYVTRLLQISPIRKYILSFLLNEQIEAKSQYNRLFNFNLSGNNLLSVLCDTFCALVSHGKEDDGFYLMKLLVVLGTAVFKEISKAISVSSLVVSKKTALLKTFRRAFFGYDCFFTELEQNSIFLDGILDVLALRSYQVKRMSTERVKLNYSALFTSITNLHNALNNKFGLTNKYYLSEVLMKDSALFQKWIKQLVYFIGEFELNKLTTLNHKERLNVLLFKILQEISNGLAEYLHYFQVSIGHFKILKLHLNFVVDSVIRKSGENIMGQMMLIRLFSLFVRDILVQKMSKGMCYKIASALINSQRFNFFKIAKDFFVEKKPENVDETKKIHIDVFSLFSDYFDELSFLSEKEKKKIEEESTANASEILKCYLELFREVRKMDQDVFRMKQDRSKTFTCPKQYALVYSFDPLFGLGLDYFMMQIITLQLNLFSFSKEGGQKQSLSSLRVSQEDKREMNCIRPWNVNDVDLVLYMLEESDIELVNNSSLKYLTALVFFFANYTYMKFIITTPIDVEIFVRYHPTLSKYVWVDSGVVSFSPTEPEVVEVVNPDIMKKIPYFNPYCPRLYKKEYEETWIKMATLSFQVTATPVYVFSYQISKFQALNDCVEKLIVGLLNFLVDNFAVKIAFDRNCFLLLRVMWMFVKFSFTKPDNVDDFFDKLSDVINKIWTVALSILAPHLTQEEAVGVQPDSNYEIAIQTIQQVKLKSIANVIQCLVIETCLELVKQLSAKKVGYPKDKK